jgi:hypothetical protein
MEIKPFKDRVLDPNKKVHVYRCLNRKGHVFSIRQNGYVVAHTTHISLRNVSFEVNYSGKMRAQERKMRNVHAYIEGYVCDDFTTTFTTPITYNPFKSINFHIKGSNCAVSSAQQLIINENGVFI